MCRPVLAQDIQFEGNPTMPRLLPNFLPRLLAACLALTLQWAGAAEGVSKNQFLIGQNITLQGGKNDYGVAVQEGIQSYLNAVNGRGGVNGRRIVLKTLDDDNKSSQAEANARQLVEQDKVFILFGSIEGGPSTAVMKAAIDLKVPFFGPIAGSPTLRRPHQALVFPVRAEHREEFRALLGYSKNIGATRVGFMRADSETGQQHLANVKLLCQELGMELVADLPFKSDSSDAQFDPMIAQLEKARVQVVFNHGSPGVYEKLIRKSRAKGLPTTFYAVNSGSAQMVKHLGPLAHGMVFTQVVPSPWERKTAITREYQEEFGRQMPGREFSYGSLEGYVTAKALVAALRLAGPEPTRESFLAGLTSASLDLNGMRAVYAKDQHAGLSFVDLAIVTREGGFRH